MLRGVPEPQTQCGIHCEGRGPQPCAADAGLPTGEGMDWRADLGPGAAAPSGFAVMEPRAARAV